MTCDRCGWPIVREHHGRTCPECGMRVCVDPGNEDEHGCPCDCLVQPTPHDAHLQAGWPPHFWNDDPLG